MTAEASLLVALMLVSSPIKYNSIDNLCLKSVVYLESGNQPIRGIAATRKVILNRAKKRGKSLCGTVREKGQFASVKRGMKFSKVKIPKEWLTRYNKAATMRGVLSDEYQWFYKVGSRTPDWRSKVVCKRIQDHYFCKLN